MTTTESFLQAKCNFSYDEFVSSADLYGAYRLWSDPRVRKSQRQLTNWVKQVRGVLYGVHWVDGRSQRGFRGLSLKNPPQRPSACAPQSNPALLKFVAEKCVFTPGARTPFADVYRAYAAWTENRSYLGSRKFSEGLRALGLNAVPAYVNGTTCRAYPDMALKDAPTQCCPTCKRPLDNSAHNVQTVRNDKPQGNRP